MALTDAPTTYLQGQFLLAMPALQDPLFQGSLVYILEHDEEGAIGLIINKALELSVDEVLQQVDENYQAEDHPQTVLRGGPVKGSRGFVFHSQPSEQWLYQINIAEGLYLTTSSDILSGLAQGQDIGDFQLLLGYAGWDAGQLEEELLANHWLNINADTQIVLHTPLEKKLQAAAQKLGIDYSTLSPHSGNA